MTPTYINRALLEWDGWLFTSDGVEEYWLHDNEIGKVEEPPNLLTDHVALMGLLGGLTEEQQRTFSMHLMKRHRTDWGMLTNCDIFKFATTPIPVLAECLWRVVGTKEEVK